VLLILCDLNGFKAYNDTFGHPAGDALLARLGTALATQLGERGHAYRIGGDEFCILARPGDGDFDETIRVATDALAEKGDGFSITAAHGAILLPREAATPTEALRMVDLRMYEQKSQGRVPADMQTMNALVSAVRERDLSLAERLGNTADLAGRVCRELGVSAAEEARIRQAAQLHDVGKVAVPDAILFKATALSEEEYALVRRHPVIGWEILRDVEFLGTAKTVVRHHHERWDGGGYPDGLAGEDIPLVARIFAVADTLDALTTDRPYRPGSPFPEARAMIRRVAGTQFDPGVVQAFDAVPDERFRELRERLG
jgi:diguanylate cyclase (GGDEF)-like protein